ncbi:MAG: hypothetical protein M1835_003100 [Candelina submexicana]|nr:MAG: hypothetical protein M1835_003100 [Candelina submexicana]
MAIWGGGEYLSGILIQCSELLLIQSSGYAYQRGYTRAEVTADSYIKSDWTDAGYVGPMFLLLGFMGALTNSSRKAANFAGFYKGIQSAGAATIYRIDALDKPYMNIFASSWALLAGSLVIAAPVIIWKVQDTVPIEEDLRFSDESLGDVVAVAPVSEKV